MTHKQKRIIAVISALSLYFGLMPAASAMHIMEGYLPVGFCVAWGAICLPFLAAGFMSIKKVLNENRKALILLALIHLRPLRKLQHRTRKMLRPYGCKMNLNLPLLQMKEMMLKSIHML